MASVADGLKRVPRCLEIRFWDFRDFAHDNPDVMWKLLQHVVQTRSRVVTPRVARRA